MDQQLELARKKTVVLAATLGLYCMLLLILPAIAVRHGVPAVWIVVPQCLAAAYLMVSIILSAREFFALRKAKGANGLQ